MQPRQAEAIRKAIQAVADNPQAPDADVSRLHGENALRVRVDDWRIVIQIEADVLYVTRIRTRGDVYKRK